VEVTGVVVDPMTIQEDSHVSFGENFGEQHIRMFHAPCACSHCLIWLLACFVCSSGACACSTP
jgi:hypothetical protein